MTYAISFRGKALILYLFFILFLSHPSLAGEPSYGMPAKIQPSGSYLFFYHNYYVEKHGPYAECRYFDILESFTDNGFTVISELREKPVNPGDYAQKAVIPIRKLLDAGVPPENIAVTGHSKGAVIALQVASLLKEPEVKYVIMAGCGIKPLDTFYPKYNDLCGNTFSIYATSDQIAGNCKSLFPENTPGCSFKEMTIDDPAGHQTFFKPDDNWVRPVIDWLKQH